MIFIAHRGNLNGSIPDLENSPEHLMNAVNQGYDIELDIWYENNKFFLGHDFPKYEIKSPETMFPPSNTWYHCKNVEILSWFSDMRRYLPNLKYFWHQNDFYTVVSNTSYIWTFPSCKLVKNSIAVMPERKYLDLTKLFKRDFCSGICSDKISTIKTGYDEINEYNKGNASPNG